jgi:HlyD family secretion protein
LFVPVEALHSQGDSVTFVIKKEGLGLVKQEVKIGQSNSDEAVIVKGLKESDVVFLSDPEGLDGKKIQFLDDTDGHVATK